MSRNRFFRMCRISCIVTSLLLIAACSRTAENQPPNIVFFIADDMYPEMFNCLPQGKGKNLTPNLDRLAGEGTLMVNQYVVSPVCTPSRYNCLTGRYASRAVNGAFLRKTRAEEGQTVIQWNTFITPPDTILPEYLNELGYATGMAGKNHVIEVKGLHRFADYHADPADPGIREKLEENYRKVHEAVLENGFDYAGGLYHNNPNFIGLSDLAVHNLDWIAGAGVEFIDRYHRQPFFLYFATTVPHGPAEADRSWNADPRITARGILDEAPGLLPPRHTLPERLRKAGLEGTGRENLLWLDDALGALMERLEMHGVLDNTIVFFFNDHGQHAKGTLYQGGVLNPSIIWKAGGFSCGDRCETLVSNVDFAPAILELAGSGDPDGNFDGVSFKGVLDGRLHAARESHYFELGYARALIRWPYKYIAIRYPGYATNWSPEERARELERYNRTREFRDMPIVNRDPSKPFSHLEVVPGGGQAEHGSYGKVPGYFDRDQLYNLEADPGEMHNLAGDPAHRKELTELREILGEYIANLPGKFDL